MSLTSCHLGARLDRWVFCRSGLRCESGVPKTITSENMNAYIDDSYTLSSLEALLIELGRDVLPK
jgi:hypothetical protein